MSYIPLAALVSSDTGSMVSFLPRSVSSWVSEALLLTLLGVISAWMVIGVVFHGPSNPPVSKPKPSSTSSSNQVTPQVQPSVGPSSANPSPSPSTSRSS